MFGIELEVHSKFAVIYTFIKLANGKETSAPSFNESI